MADVLDVQLNEIRVGDQVLVYDDVWGVVVDRELTPNAHRRVFVVFPGDPNPGKLDIPGIYRVARTAVRDALPLAPK